MGTDTDTIDEEGLDFEPPDITADDIHGIHSEDDDEGPTPADDETEGVRDWTVEIGGQKFNASIALSSGLTVQRAGVDPQDQIHWLKAERQQFKAQLDRVMHVAKTKDVLDNVNVDGLDKNQSDRHRVLARCVILQLSPLHEVAKTFVGDHISDDELWGCFAVELLLRYRGKAFSVSRFYNGLEKGIPNFAGMDAPPVPQATFMKYRRALEDACKKETVKEYIGTLKDATNPNFKRLWTKCVSNAELTFKLSIDDDFMHLSSYVGVVRIIKGKGVGCMNTTATCPVTGIITGWSSLAEGRGASDCRGELVQLLGDGGFDWMQYVDRGYVGDRVSMI